MKDIQKFSNDLFSIAVQMSDGEFLFDVESVVKSLGFTKTEIKNGKQYTSIRWDRVNSYLRPQVGETKISSGDYISESMVYKLAFKAGNATAEEFQDWLAVDVLPQIRKTGSYKSSQPKHQDDLAIKRMNAEARLKNANARQAKLLEELSRNATTDVNKSLLQNKAVEILTGEKLLEMPKLKQKLFDCEQIAKILGVLSKKGKPHGTAVSQLINTYIDISEEEFEILPESVGGWSGSVTKYTESVLDKVRTWLEDQNYPSKIQGSNKKYHVQYGM
ncbi:hypothetical protein I6N96_01235 [Enterococcus sp. BWM-S5]|uniref:Bro-N domain-containing protein n=1 Tax=Enterococcus larvae TaxID=2794352 RepID=A0ABS4CEP7_9ENTE|nr:BRO family protein [Enterococcus larvae]MBP1044885.1 hypothetical protein [Enterococcus larvae]